jgi:hypothetical protein
MGREVNKLDAAMEVRSMSGHTRRETQQLAGKRLRLGEAGAFEFGAVARGD